MSPSAQGTGLSGADLPPRTVTSDLRLSQTVALSGAICRNHASGMFAHDAREKSRYQCSRRVNVACARDIREHELFLLSVRRQTAIMFWQWRRRTRGETTPRPLLGSLLDRYSPRRESGDRGFRLWEKSESLSYQASSIKVAENLLRLSVERPQRDWNRELK